MGAFENRTPLYWTLEMDLIQLGYSSPYREGLENAVHTSFGS